MALTTNLPYNNRTLNDANFVANATIGTTAASFNLVQAVPYPTTEVVLMNLTTTTLSGSNTTAAVIIQDSADNVTFTNVAVLGSVSVNVTSPGVVGVTGSWALPPGVKQYVRASSSVSGATTGGYTASLGF